MRLNSKVYDVLKYVAMIVLPALSALWLGLGQTWGWSSAEQVAASIMIVDACLGTLLQVNSVRYRNDVSRMDGFISSSGADPDTGMPDLKMVITRTPDELLQNKTVTLKVGQPPAH